MNGVPLERNERARSGAGSGRRTLESDLARLRDRAVDTAREASRVIRGTVESEPYVATAVALGLGFVVGGGLMNPSTRTLLLGAGARFLGAWMAEGLESDEDEDAAA